MEVEAEVVEEKEEHEEVHVVNVVFVMGCSPRCM